MNQTVFTPTIAIADKKNLEDALKSLRKLIRYVTHPALATVKIEMHDGFMNLITTDLRTYRMIRIPTNGNNGFARACAPIDLLYSIVRKLNPKYVTLSLIGDRLYIKQGGNETAIDCLPTDEFPECPDNFKLKHKLELDRAELLKHMKEILKTCSKDSTKNLLQGYNMRAKNGILTISSTDGHRLTQKDMEIPQGISFDATLRPFLMGDIDAPTAKVNLPETVELLIIESDCNTQTAAVLTAINKCYRSQTWSMAWDGKYPDVDHLRNPIGRGIVIDKGLLLAQLEIAKIYWQNSESKKEPYARLIANSLTRQFTIEAINEFGAMSADLTPCTKFIDRGFDLLINSKYLIDAIKSMKGDIEINSNGAVCYIGQLGSSDEPILIAGANKRDATRAFPEPICEYIIKEYDDRISVSSPRNAALIFDVSKKAPFSKSEIPRENLIAELMERVIDNDRIYLTKAEAKALYALRA